MTKLLKSYTNVKIISVKKISDMADADWDWRKDLVGQTGTLYLYKRAQLYRAILDTETHCFYTGRGLLEIENNIIVLRTRNTEYKYMIISEEAN
jgi:hypothetical protein